MASARENACSKRRKRHLKTVAACDGKTSKADIKMVDSTVVLQLVLGGKSKIPKGRGEYSAV